MCVGASIAKGSKGSSSYQKQKQQLGSCVIQIAGVAIEKTVRSGYVFTCVQVRHRCRGSHDRPSPLWYFVHPQHKGNDR